MHIQIKRKTFEKNWKGTIFTAQAEVFGHASFDYNTKRFKVTRGKDELIIDKYGAHETQGQLYYNGESCGKINIDAMGEIMITDTSNKTILLFTRDSFRRRKKWAYRQGFSLSQANMYAAWGGLLISQHSIVSSIVSYGNWILPTYEDRYPLLSKTDEANIASVAAFEQLLISAVACHYLNIKPFHQPTVPDTDLLEVPTFVKNEEKGILSINPDAFPSRKAEKFILNYPWETCSIIALSTIYFIVLLFWDFPETFTFRTHIVAPVMTFLLMNGIPGSILLIQLLTEPYFDSQKDEIRLYKKVHSIIMRK